MLLLYLVSFISTFIFLSIALYLDVRHKIIYNKFVIISFFYSCILKVLEFIIYKLWELWFLLIIPFFVLFTLFIPFCCNSIRGGDVKVLFVLVLFIPLMYLYFFLSYFFLLVLFFTLLFPVINYLCNSITKDRAGFKMFLQINPKNRKFKILYIKTYCRLINISKIIDNRYVNFRFKSPDIIYNSSRKRFQIMVLNLFPFALPLFLSYLAFLFLIVFFNL